MKNIVLGMDGTWNRPGQMDSGWSAPTNVLKALRAVSGESNGGVSQVVVYEPGIGAYSRSWLRGATGLGIEGTILRAYEALSGLYKSGDNIYLFGFSRGASAARSLANLVATCGIVDGSREAEDQVKSLSKQAYRLYKFRGILPATAIKAFRKTHCHHSREIHFVGVWDTVAALGLPVVGLRRVTRPLYAFHNLGMNEFIRNAYHALAVDERRRSFVPVLWRGKDCSPRQVIEQVWFPGSHSNVGGGFKDSGLSDAALIWMLAKAASAGLGVDQAFVKERIAPYSWLASINLHAGFAPGAWRSIGRRDSINESLHHSVLALCSDPLTDYESPEADAAYRKGRIPHARIMPEEVVDEDGWTLWQKKETSPIRMRSSEYSRWRYLQRL